MDNDEDKGKFAEMWHDFYIMKCPHCGITIIVHNTELNCRIFRCSHILNPHATEYECKQQYRADPALGCCKPFKVLPDFSIIKCEYNE